MNRSAAEGFTLEQVMSSPFPSSLTTARTGRIGWTFSSKGIRNIWIADPPEFRARPVTRYEADDGAELTSVRLTPDGRTVLYVRGGKANARNEFANPLSGVREPKQQVWALDLDRGEDPRLLGELSCGPFGDTEDIQISPDGRWAAWASRRQLWIAAISEANSTRSLGDLRGDNSQPRWSPDSTRIAFVSHRGDHSFIGVYELGGNAISWVAPSVDRDRLPRWSHDGRRIAWIRVRGGRQREPLLRIEPMPWAIWVGNPRSAEAKPIWHSGSDLASSYPAWSASRSFHFARGRILFAYEKDGWNHLYSVPATGGRETLLTPGEFDVEHVALSVDGNSVIYSSNEAGADPKDADRRHIWRAGMEGESRPTPLSTGTGCEYEPLETGDGQFVVCFGSAGTLPKMPYVLRGGERRMIAPEALPADFPSAQLVEPTQKIFKNKDGWTIHGQLFMPTGHAPHRPALLFMHGGWRERQMLLGFHYIEYYHRAYAFNQYLASRGYVVLSVNFRTGTMYGREFREISNGGPGGAADYEDILSAARLLRSLPEVDAEKIGLWGGSYGGYLTALGLARNSDLFSAGVDVHGVHDWSLYGDFARAEDAEDIDEARRLAFESSPIAALSTWKSAVLLVHGDDDRNVDFSQTVDLVQRLRALGAPVEQLVVPDDTHYFVLWRNWIRVCRTAFEFLECKLNHDGAPD